MSYEMLGCAIDRVLMAGDIAMRDGLISERDAFITQALDELRQARARQRRHDRIRELAKALLVALEHEMAHPPPLGIGVAWAALDEEIGK